MSQYMDWGLVEEESYFDYAKYEVCQWREFIYRIMSETEKVESKEIKLLTYFSIIEMMAQEYYNYPQKELQDSFAEFVLEFQDKYVFLESVDPITLFYRVENIVSSKVNLNNLVDREIYVPNDKILSDKVTEIQSELKKKKGEEYTEKKLKQHRYVELLYRMRCRLTHEFSATHTSFIKRIDVPNYKKCPRQYISEGRIVSDHVWQLRFPVNFIKDLCLNCFENYMSYCLEENIPPNKNNGLDRPCVLSWYSR